MTKYEYNSYQFNQRTKLASDEASLYVECDVPEYSSLTDEQVDSGINYVGIDQYFEDEQPKWDDVPETSQKPILDDGFVKYLTSLVDPIKTWFDRTPSMEGWVKKCVDVFFLYQRMAITQLEAKRRVLMYLEDAKKECRMTIEKNFVQSNF